MYVHLVTHELHHLYMYADTRMGQMTVVIFSMQCTCLKSLLFKDSRFSRYQMTGTTISAILFTNYFAKFNPTKVHNVNQA